MLEQPIKKLVAGDHNGGIGSVSPSRLARGSGSRSLPAGHSFHITLRCNSRQFLIAKRIRRDVLLVVLEKAKQNYSFRLVGICLMANHIHLLIKPDDASQLPKLMHWVKTTNGP